MVARSALHPHTGPQGPEPKAQAGSAIINLLYMFYMSVLPYRTGQKVSRHPARAGDPNLPPSCSSWVYRGPYKAYAHALCGRCVPDTLPPPTHPFGWPAAAAAALHSLFCPAPVAVTACHTPLLLLAPLGNAECCPEAAGRVWFWLLLSLRMLSALHVAARACKRGKEQLLQSVPTQNARRQRL